MDLLEQVKERLSIFKNLYDVIGIVDSIKKKTIIIDNKIHNLNDSCNASNFAEELISSVNEKSVKDELTGVYNRTYINERLSADMIYNRISELPLSIIIADINFFGRINDKYGHVNVDKVLIDFLNLILKSIRNNTDWVSRYGGKEFIIVLNDTDLKNAYKVTDKLRKQLEDTTFKYGDININITVSFRVYSVTDDIEFSEFLSKIDKNLCEAKFIGRNRTIISQENVNEVGEIDIYNKYIKLSNLTNKINELRDILNELCDTLDTCETNPDRLIISQSLDELIVEYMKEINNLK